MPDKHNADNQSTEPSNPEIHPRHIKFSIWDRTDAITVDTDKMIIIGRSADDQDVTVDLADHHGRLLGVSRRHAVIFLTPSGVGIRDLNSANGTSLNGEPLDGGKAYELQHGDELQIGGLYVTVHFSK